VVGNQVVDIVRYTSFIINLNLIKLLRKDIFAKLNGSGQAQ
jgi:hypothetical protein